MSLAQVTMRELVNEVQETAHLALYNPSDKHVIFASSVQCDLPVRYVIESGTGTTLNAGATGKAILAYLPEEVVSQLELPSFTSNTITDRARLLKELATIRRRGYATSSGGRIEGASGVAAAILSRDQIIGALTISVPTYRLEKKKIPFDGETVSSAARSISVRLRMPPAAPR